MNFLQDVDQQQLTRVVTLVRDVLGSDAIAAYLFGSAVLGGLQSESDLDVLAVSRRRTTHEEKQRVVNRLLAISGKPIPRGRWRRVELTIVVEREVRPWHYPPNFDFQYGDWLRSQFEIGNVEPWRTTVNPDLATLITMVVRANTALFGPPPTQMFDPVPPTDLINAMMDSIDSLHGNLQADTRNVLLTFARIWSTLATGVIRSKNAAADWALHRLPEKHRLVLARARAIYLSQHPEQWDDIGDQLEPHVDYVIGVIRRLASDSASLHSS